MSGCKEGILVDLSETPEEPLVSVTDSIELLRDEPLDSCSELVVTCSPLKTVDSLLDLPVQNTILLSERLPAERSPLRLLDEETFDFDLPLSPGTASDKSSSTPDDEEEVFFGPVGFRERCVATVVDSVKKETKPLSPLNPRQIAEICKEANMVAVRISSAASDKKSRHIPKENLFCAKQLKLDKIANSKQIVGSLVKSVSKIRTSDEYENKENPEKQMEVDDSNLKSLELFLKNEVPEERADGKTSSSESEGNESPTKKHRRSETYTVDKTDQSLPLAENRKTLPVIRTEQTEDRMDTDEHEGQTCNRRVSAGKARPSISKLQQPASKLVKSGLKAPKSVVKPEVKEPVIDASSASKPQPKSRLSVPKATSLLPSKLKPIGVTSSAASTVNCSVTSSATHVSVKPVQQIPQKSALPGSKGRGLAVGSKLQLIKPNGLQRSSSLRVKSSTESSVKSGPLKAFTPAGQPEQAESVTPTKEEKKVQRKNLSSSFSTPNKTGSTSSTDSPASSLSKRSCLPTPTKSRLGSSGSIPSPCGSRTSSTSSVRSLDSPLVRGSRPATRSAVKMQDNNHIDATSPSATKAKRPLVTHTPNLPKKKLSQWSPVQKKKPHDLVDQAIMCTKKLRR